MTWTPKFFDSYEDDKGTPYQSRNAPVTRCSRCGSTAVRWRQQTGKWTLFSLQPGVLHECSPMADADDFA